MQPDPIEQLDDFLSSDHAADDCMLIDELDGYLTAIIVSPNSPRTEVWMPNIWGEAKRPPNCSDQKANEISEIILQMHSDTATSLKNGIPFEPLLHQDIDNEGNIQTNPLFWCIGFLKGITLDEDYWSSISTEITHLLDPIIYHSEEAKEVDPIDHIQNLLDGNTADMYSIDDITLSVEKIYKITSEIQVK